MTREVFAAEWATRLGPDHWRAGVPLAPLTTFHVGGPAEWLADLTQPEEVEMLLRDACAARVPVSVLGGGSNVLVSDQGVPGVVVRLHLHGISQTASDTVRADAGVTINGLVRWTVGRGLGALEAWAGTPGTVGGAIYGNAHWAGQNVSDLVRCVRLVAVDGTASTVPAAEMEFAYDTSRLKRTREIVTWADFRVSAAEPAVLREKARQSLHYRKATQPLAMPSAGCIFQNPDAADVLPGDVPRSAGALIDRAGLKGVRRGGARISDRHANFIVNEGGATAEDVRALVDAARAAVREKFGISLRDEIVYLGTF